MAYGRRPSYWVFVSHKTISPLTDRYGTAGVWIFFVLSGFLITRILAEARGKIEAGRGSFISGLSQFYGRRTARIFPVPLHRQLLPEPVR